MAAPQYAQHSPAHRRAVGRRPRPRRQHHGQQLSEAPHVSSPRSVPSRRQLRRKLRRRLHRMLRVLRSRRAAQERCEAGIGDQDAAAVVQQHVAAPTGLGSVERFKTKQLS